MSNEKSTSSSKIPLYTKLYTELFQQFNAQYEKLKEQRALFPVKYSGEDQVEFEDFTLEASNLKHQAIDLNKVVLIAYTNAGCDLEYLEAHVLFNNAKDILKDLGFDSFTGALLSSAVASHKDLSELKKAIGKLKALQEAVKALPKAFETDETNNRIFSGYKHKLGGF
jgi:hypothetical protein